MQSFTVAANSRYTIDVNGLDPALRDTSMAVLVESTNDQPIIVERTMWWPLAGTGWTEGHNAFGTTSTGPRWLVAEGEQGGAKAASTYVLIANTSERERVGEGDGVLRGRGRAVGDGHGGGQSALHDRRRVGRSPRR